jgi:outer membrane protein TolC
MKRIKPLLHTLLFTYLFTCLTVQAQVRKLSLDEAVEFAIANNAEVLNSKLDAEIANAKVWEITSAGLPQVSGDISLNHFFAIQRFVLEYPLSFGGPPVTPPGSKEGDPVAFGLALTNQMTANLTATQLLFNGSYFVGLQAARTYNELAAKNVIKSKIDIAETVTKAYCLVLINEEKSKLFDVNIQRIDSLLRQTNVLFNTGFAEKIDVDRLTVTRNNLVTEKTKVANLIKVGKNALKLAMGLKISEEIELSSSLQSLVGLQPLSVQTNFNYPNRIEYSLLQTQQNLARLDLKNIRSGYMPSLVAVGTLGANSGASQFENLFRFGQAQRWADFSFIGVKMNVPIFDGFTKKFKADQAKLSLKKIDNGFKQLENAIDFEITKAQINYENAYETVKSQKENMQLAEEVLKVTKIKYESGVGPNIEVINAEAALREAQINYYSALYDLQVAKIDYEKATGNFYNK